MHNFKKNIKKNSATTLLEIAPTAFYLIGFVPCKYPSIPKISQVIFTR
jgi:hypothetical protein